MCCSRSQNNLFYAMLFTLIPRLGIIILILNTQPKLQVCQILIIFLFLLIHSSASRMEFVAFAFGCCVCFELSLMKWLWKDVSWVLGLRMIFLKKPLGLGFWEEKLWDLLKLGFLIGEGLEDPSFLCRNLGVMEVSEHFLCFSVMVLKEGWVFRWFF